VALDAPQRATIASAAPGLTVDSAHGQASALPPRGRPASARRRASRLLVGRRASPRRQVGLGDNYFHPGRLTIDKGTKVTWNWKGYLNHNVHVKSGPSKFHSPPQVQGSFSHVFNRRGTYHLYCTIHPNMKETIVVK